MIFLSITIALQLLQKNSCTSQCASAELDGNMAIIMVIMTNTVNQEKKDTTKLTKKSHKCNPIAGITIKNKS